jgi:hypothetical protein
MKDTAFIRKRLQQLREEASPAEPPFAERMLQDVLDPLLIADGSTLEAKQTHSTLDWIARKPSESGVTQVGIEYKHYADLGRPIGVTIVERVFTAALARSLDRSVLFPATVLPPTLFDSPSTRVLSFSFSLWMTSRRGPSTLPPASLRSPKVFERLFVYWRTNSRFKLPATLQH